MIPMHTFVVAYFAYPRRHLPNKVPAFNQLHRELKLPEDIECLYNKSRDILRGGWEHLHMYICIPKHRFAVSKIREKECLPASIFVSIVMCLVYRSYLCVSKLTNCRNTSERMPLIWIVS